QRDVHAARLDRSGDRRPPAEPGTGNLRPQLDLPGLPERGRGDERAVDRRERPVHPAGGRAVLAGQRFATIVQEPPSSSATFSNPARWYIIRDRLCGATDSESDWTPSSRACTMQARRIASPIPFRRCSGTTAIESSGVFSSMNPYPGSSAGKTRYHAAPTGTPSSSAITPPSPDRPHPS